MYSCVECVKLTSGFYVSVSSPRQFSAVFCFHCFVLEKVEFLFLLVMPVYFITNACLVYMSFMIIYLYFRLNILFLNICSLERAKCVHS